MAGLEDTLHKAVPGGNIGKPLMLALLALLASGALFAKRHAGPSAGTGAQPTPDQGTGGLLGGLGGLVDQLQKGGLGNAINSWIGHAKTSRSRLVSWAPLSAPTSSKCWRSAQACPKKRLPGSSRRSCRGWSTSSLRKVACRPRRSCRKRREQRP